MAKKLVSNDYTPTHDEIAAQAYEIYLREGCVAGRDLDHWLQAEQEVRARANGNGNGSSNGVSHALVEAPSSTVLNPTPATLAEASTASASRQATRRTTAKR